MTIYNKGIFIFRRDLRIIDNVGLYNALRECNEVMPVFIFDPIQKEHDFFAYNAFDFMIESLSELSSTIESMGGYLNIIHDSPIRALNMLIEKYSPNAVYINNDYTPYSTERDSDIERHLSNNGIILKQYDDILLAKPDSMLSKSGRPYSIFSAFYNNIIGKDISIPLSSNNKNFSSNKITESTIPQKYNISPQRTIIGGRKNGLKILERIDDYNNYDTIRNIMEEETTMLAAHLKFGTIGSREAYHMISSSLGKEHSLLRQLVWREYYYHIAMNNPHIFGSACRKEYDNIVWDYDEKKIIAWKEGMTGFPIVDAGMRQLIETGYMHNRTRMICASFLTRDLHADWRIGEKHYAKYLTDYDPCINNGNWQYISSTGCDAQPYYRIFNPWTQQQKHDANAVYIKRWVRELRDVEPIIIHSMHKNKVKGYPEPIVDHSNERIIALERYKRRNIK